MSIGVQLQHIGSRGWWIGTEFFHETDGTLNNVAQLAGTLVGPLQDGCRTLQMVACKHIGGRQALSPWVM